MPPETRAAVVVRLRELGRAAGGPVPSAAVRAAAVQYGVTPRTVWRWLSAPSHGARPRASLSRDELVAVARHNGNVRAAWSELRDGGLALSYSQFGRRLKNTDTDFVAGVTLGVDAAIQRGLYVQRETPSKMAVVGFDHTELSVLTVSGSGRPPSKPWVSLLVDWGTRYLLGVALTDGRGVRGDPNTETVVALVGGVLAGRGAPDGTPVGGRIGVVVADNALAHLADAVVNGYALVGMTPHFIAPGSPWENGRTERLVATLESEFSARQPGYTHHLPLRYGKGAWSGYMTTEELAVRLDGWVGRYNAERPHSGLGGRTPLQAWKDDPTLVERVDPELVRHGFLAERRVRRISKNGVRFRGVDYTAPELAGHVGRAAVVRYLPNDRGFVEVYVGGAHLCRAVPHAALTLEQRADLARVRRNRIGRIDRIVKTSARLRETEALRERDEAALGDPGVPDPDADRDGYLRLAEGRDVDG